MTQTAQELISDWILEDADDLPDDTPVVVKIGDRSIIFEDLGILRAAISSRNAVAPDLIEALEGLVDDLEIRSKAGVVDCSDGVYVRAKQALSKATHKSQEG